jgi:hypothetical protein
MSRATLMGFQRRLGLYLATNHPRGGSGRLTRRQSRRLWKKNPAEMLARREAYAGTRARREWS